MAGPFLFVSYRRDDATGSIEYIYQRLVMRFGRESVFRDIDEMRLGEDFRHQLQEALSRCDVFLAVIGPHWAGRGERGVRRLDDPKDYVRLEIETALRRQIPVIPV